MKKQRGWAALLVMGLAAVLGTGGMIAVTEEATDAPGVHLVDALAGKQQVQIAEGTTESEGTTYMPASMPEQGK